ncbi:MAG: filamentous hemagglutinin N-terminal domain-containing protein [Aliarcobacter sp.]|nr:filamentous hemagglutinin N-terminal domain-containing protein [Aliarcobacter sp.]
MEIKNLAGRNTASTILNEVTSRNKTELRGFTEVAGDRANVVVANPNGIYINGAGFINTSKATITTGNISATNGNINHRVENGTIEIDAEGLNVSNVDKAELYAKTVKLNAQIHAKDIDIVTGKNNISSDGKIEKLSQEDTSKPEVSIDSSSLGGIYANKISLIGTQDGVGVNLPIEIAAQDNLKLSADGKITVDKAISQKSIEVTSISSDVDINNIYGNSVKIEAKNELNNKNIIASKTDINLKATKIVNENVIASGVDEILKDSTNGSINITSDELENKNTIYAKDNVNINTKEVVNTKESIIKSKKEINITSENISNEDNVSFEAEENINLINQKKIVSNKINIVSKQASVNIETNTLEIKNSKVNANKDVILKAEEKIDAEDINVQANKIDISTKELILSQKKNNSEDVDSKIVSNTTIDITANNIKNVNGYIGANENINITSKDIENSDGIIVTNKNLNIDSPENGLFNNLKGILQASKNLVLNVFDFKGDESIIQAENVNVKANDVNGKSLNIVALNGDLKLDTNNLNLSGDNQSKGLLYSTNDILINSKKFISNYLNVQTNNNIDINSLDITLNNSTIQSVVDLNDSYANGYKQGNINLITDKLDLNNTILASKDLNIKNIDDTKSENVIINNSILDGNNDINLKLENLNLNNSSLLALNNINIENSADMIIQDEVKIEASNDLVLNTNNLSIFSDNSQVVANNNLNLNVINKFVNLGILKSKNTTLNTNYLVNYGFVSALNNLTINAYDIDNKAGITVVDLQNENQKDSILTINANNLTNYNTIYVNGDMNLNIKNQLLNKTDNSVVNIGIDKATIFAVNNLNIGNEDLGLRTEKVVNDKALIQTKNGDINIFTNSLEHLASELKVYGEYVENTEGKFIIGGERIDTKAYRDRGGYSYNYFTIYTDIMTYEKPEIAQILSGKDIYFNTNSINNKYSLISANNDIYFESNVLTNKNIDIVKLTTTKKDIYYGNKKCRHHGTWML